MKKNALTVLAFSAAVLTMFYPKAGVLDPASPPGPTMHTLEEIYTKQTEALTKLDAIKPPEFSKVTQTGQTGSYASGDDAFYRYGVQWPSPRFEFVAGTGDAVVKDKLTGLMWTKDANSDGTKTWTTALSYCESLSLGGFNDWRLPNIRELESLTNYGTYPALPIENLFTNTNNGVYWSSSTLSGDNSFAFYVSRQYGTINFGNKTTANYVHAVRGGN